jgi:hypothetical protein
VESAYISTYTAGADRDVTDPPPAQNELQ